MPAKLLIYYRSYDPKQRLRDIQQKSDVAFMTGKQILDWYLAVGPQEPSGTP